ncbi:hypothetical protein GUJ93_ZPchr0009g1244 [Zizania palustris]|uniref:Uncharacterized protein n=1 Tax=Zizania palustris TaxID=103762 RepID=A0A8J5RHP9_ZIZPA|nr:hypothetical protein GUJ93_ZPchr0009g1244 [Zizania palustris]
MALAAALSRAAARLLRPLGPQPSPLLSLRSRQLCGLPSDDTPAAPGAAKPSKAEIIADVGPVIKVVKDVLHSDRCLPRHQFLKIFTFRYGDGEFLNSDDEKIIVEKLLVHHPRSNDKIGCGLNAIMVDRHTDFRETRCLYVVRTNGDTEDFSYRKCLRGCPAHFLVVKNRKPFDLMQPLVDRQHQTLQGQNPMHGNYILFEDGNNNMHQRCCPFPHATQDWIHTAALVLRPRRHWPPPPPRAPAVSGRRLVPAPPPTDCTLPADSGRRPLSLLQVSLICS